MFNGTRNVVVNGGLFLANAESSTRSPNLEPLLDKVALNAILNAGGRADEVGCYPGTREMVMGEIERWMDGQSEPDHRMLWLSGPAGAGKSAIMQTVAERCKERGTHATNFFFFRGDATRNDAQPLVATLVYQLFDFYPTLRELVKDCLAAKPLTYKAAAEEQFMQFISSPFKIIRDSSPIHQPIIFIIDGLDECDDERKQGQIISSLHALVQEDNSPFRVLVASRAESHLVMSFNKIRTSVQSIFLDGKYGPDGDIHRFVVAKFDEIKRLHALSHTLSEDWPTSEDVAAITNKSSGQFIYAATVMRFIQYSPESPALSLRTIREMRPSESAHDSPLAHLNAVYSYIFSKARNISAVKTIICAYFLLDRAHVDSTNSGSSLQYLLEFVGYEAIEVMSFFAKLVAIVQVTAKPKINLVFYHASLADYLKDKSQSGVYHVDFDAIALELSLVCLRKFNDTKSLMFTNIVLSQVGYASTELSNALLRASTRQIKAHPVPWNVRISSLLYAIESLYFAENRALFRLLLQNWIHFAYMNDINIEWPEYFRNMSAFSYYRWYSATEWAKFVLGISK